MNHAQDALYWRLKNPQIRDLASLLCAPPLWHNPHELSRVDLLGERGFRLLLSWDDDPFFRLPENMEHDFLGRYAENLLAFWLENAPHTELLAKNCQIEGVGEMDFLAKLNGEIHHIELCCKYFGGENAPFCGLNPKDDLQKKVHKINQQIQMTQHENTQNWLRENGFSGSLKNSSVIRGNIFTPHAHIPPECAPHAWSGFWFADFADGVDFVAQNVAFSGSRVVHLARNGYLAPARVPFELTHSWQENPTKNQGIAAIVLPRPDGFWHEHSRMMFGANVRA